jgi:hypothetical protein
MSKSVIKVVFAQSRLAGGAMALLLASAYAAPASAQTATGNEVIISDNIDANTAATTDAGATAPTVRANAATTGKPVKVEAGSNFELQVDNGWVIYQGLATDPTLNFYNAFGTKQGSYKLVTPGAGSGQGDYYDAGGIVFGPCTPSSGNRCGGSDNGTNGVGIGFGQQNDGSPSGGWVSNANLVSTLTNPNGSHGSMNALAISGKNSFAVGWDSDATGSNRALADWLDGVSQNYIVLRQVDLGTLGGATSQAFGVSKGGTYIVGMASTSTNKDHAVYMTTPAIQTSPTGCGGNATGTVSTCWIDISSKVASAVATAGYGAVSKSRALIANDAGYIAGSAVVKETFGGRKSDIDVGFVYNINTASVTVYGMTGANVIPMIVMNDGSVIGNLNYVLPKGTTGLPVYHPFKAVGSTVTDYGLPTGAYSCRANNPNHLGQIVGACITSTATSFGGGTAFYLDTTAATPAYLDLNADLHAKNDATNPTYKNYVYVTASSIDDEDEITVMGISTSKTGTIQRAGFLAEPGSY